MTDTAISPLRRRMIEDMTIRQFKASTQHTYVRFVKDFSIFFGRSPNKAAFEDVRRYQLHLISRGTTVRLKPATHLPAVSTPPCPRSQLNTGRSTRPRTHRTHHRPRKLLSSQRVPPPSRQPAPSNPHKPLLLNLASPRFRSLQVFERRPAEPVAGSSRVAGRHPKTSTKADIPILFDHLVGADQDGCR
jgi:hypothetical protein